MTLDELMDRANALYPDNMILRYYQEPKRNHGDTLAKFIVLELQDTFDPDAPEHEQLSTARRALFRASQDIMGIQENL